VVQRNTLFRWSASILLSLVVLASSLFLVRGERQTTARAAVCWQAAITEQWTDLSLVGSVLRVSVEGIAGLPVVVRSGGDFSTVNWTGTKPEYGPFVAEYAPMTRGQYFIEPEGLGLVHEVLLDGRSYVRVDFTPLSCGAMPTATLVPAPAATQPPPPVTVLPQPTPTFWFPSLTATPLPPTPAPPPAGWQGRIAQHQKDPSGGVYWATIAVRVIGQPAGQQVDILRNGWGARGTTGTKPEHGPDACEFGGLDPGTYRITPVGLGANLDVTVERGDFVLVEFYQAGWAPSIRWAGQIVENTSGSQPIPNAAAAITVVVEGRPWHDVEIRANGWSAQTETGTKPEYGPSACEFGGLGPGTYTLTPKDLGVSVQVTMDGWGWAMVRFFEVPGYGSP
jgi:hypothetical protein